MKIKDGNKDINILFEDRIFENKFSSFVNTSMQQTFNEI
jgi:hypothetical protein